MAEPFPKSAQLERGPKRPARIKASRARWVELRREKLGACRCYGVGLGPCLGRVELHHIVPRAQLGDDLAANLAPLCTSHHRCITERHEQHLLRFAECLTDAEYAYCIQKLGEGALERLFGVMTR